MQNAKNVAVYLRISEDDGTHGDSQSISGQRDLINQYIESNAEFETANIVEFSDDGYTGTNFERPSMKKLLEKIKNGSIQCLIVKDFSRFGRNYIDVGDYLEQIFPFLGIRFISINDNYDSAVNGIITGDIGIAFKNIYNDYYCKDLSRKIKSGLKTLWKSGANITPFGIYGYRKCKNDKHKLEIDENTAPFVRRIFAAAVAGERFIDIARKLNAEQVPTPYEYLRTTYNLKQNKNQKLQRMWTSEAISRTLKDVRYLGMVANGKRPVLSMASRYQIHQPMSEWCIRENMHEPLVSKEDFDIVENNRIKLKKKGGRYCERNIPSDYLPIRIACGGCGRAMVISKSKGISYYCMYKSFTNDYACFSDKLEVEKLKEVLMATIHGLQGSFSEITQRAKAKGKRSISDSIKQLNNLQKDVERLTNDKLTLYTLYSDNDIDKDEYLAKRKSADETIQRLSKKIKELEFENHSVAESSIAKNPVYEILKDFSQPVTYSENLIKQLIDHVIVYSENNIEIQWKFEDAFLRQCFIIDFQAVV